MSGVAIGAAAVTAAGSYLASRNSGSSGSGSSSGTTTTVQDSTAIPTWSSEQSPYVWGEGYEFEVPQLSQGVIDYADSLTQGTQGQGVMSVSDLVANINSLAGSGAEQGDTSNPVSGLLGWNSIRPTSQEVWAAASNSQPTEEAVTADPNTEALQSLLLRDYVDRQVDENQAQYGNGGGWTVPHSSGGATQYDQSGSFYGQTLNNGISDAFRDTNMEELNNSGAFGDLDYNWLRDQYYGE